MSPNPRLTVLIEVFLNTQQQKVISFYFRERVDGLTFIARDTALRAISDIMTISNGFESTIFHILKENPFLSEGMKRWRGLAFNTNCIHAR